MTRVRLMLNNDMAYIGDDPVVRARLLAAGIGVRKGIAGQLPTGKTGGRRVGAFAKRAYCEVLGSGVDVRAQVGTKWRLGHLIEYGSVNNPVYAPVRRAAASVGLVIRDAR